VNKREPYGLSIAESRQLGKVPDSVLARRTGRTISEVLAERECRRIKPCLPPHSWTASEIKLRGRYSDMDIARRLRRDRNDVRKERTRLSTPKKDALLGTMPGKKLAASTGRTVAAVRHHRKQILGSELQDSLEEIPMVVMPKGEFLQVGIHLTNRPLKCPPNQILKIPSNILSFISHRRFQTRATVFNSVVIPQVAQSSKTVPLGRVQSAPCLSQ
jgi:hypothetical protein